MKTITCKQMGGSCDAKLQGETADEMIEAGREHVHAAADAGDEAHKQVVAGMEGMSEEQRAEWVENFKNNVWASA